MPCITTRRSASQNDHAPCFNITAEYLHLAQLQHVQTELARPMFADQGRVPAAEGQRLAVKVIS